mmetsp:Transcript_30192/g.86492  ORF Transcript_30192/g.86492 Transcript_30192/m.86492 type:complete len:221 (-) Transcript_30192:441-1103(-)
MWPASRPVLSLVSPIQRSTYSKTERLHSSRRSLWVLSAEAVVLAVPTCHRVTGLPLRLAAAQGFTTRSLQTSLWWGKRTSPPARSSRRSAARSRAKPSPARQASTSRAFSTATPKSRLQPSSSRSARCGERLTASLQLVMVRATSAPISCSFASGGSSAAPTMKPATCTSPLAGLPRSAAARRLPASLAAASETASPSSGSDLPGGELAEPDRLELPARV